MDPLTIALFVRSNWKLILGVTVIGALTVALGVSRLQLTVARNEFESYKIKAAAEAIRIQKAYDTTTREADIIYIQAAPKIITQTKTVVNWITRNVENIASCPSPDLIRVYNASITGGGLPEAAAP